MNAISKWMIALALLSGPLASVAQEYTVTELRTPTLGVTSYGYGINAIGQATGNVQTSDPTQDGAPHAFLYSNGVMQDLGTLGGPGTLGGWVSFGFSINNSGQVTGFSYTAGNAAAHAFIYSNRSMRDLGTLGGTDSFGDGINDNGQVTGASDVTGDATQHAFLYSNGSMKDLGTLPGGEYSEGVGINDDGQITGLSDVAGNTAEHAFLYSKGSMRDLGTLPGGTDSNGYGINDKGQVTGTSDTAPDYAVQHAFLYSNRSMRDLGTLGGMNSYGFGINDRGQVVGESNTAGNVPGTDHAFLYSNGSMQDLNHDIGSANTLYTLTSANAINDRGQILVDATVNATGDVAVLLLTPIPAALLAALRNEVTDVGPGTSLADKVTAAQAHYAASDTQATCAMLAGFVNEVKAQAGKKISQQLDAKLIADAQTIGAVIGCN